MGYISTLNRHGKYSGLRNKNVRKHNVAENAVSSNANLAKNWEWYEPPETSAPVHFFLNTSLHGLHYLGKEKLHMCERVFWLMAFSAAVITSIILIWHMWDNYVTVPIVTIFNPKENTLEQIPFPSVTVCSINKIRQSKYDEYESDAFKGILGELSNETLMQKFANILDVYHICKSSKTFTQKFYNFNDNKTFDDLTDLEKILYLHRREYKHLLDPTGTIRNASQPCDEMILFCLWLDTVRNCSDLFVRIETDYGVCCTFNMIPLTLLRTFVQDPTDNPEFVKDWSDADLHYENLLFDEITRERKYPNRQQFPGRSAGLSILVDPNMEEYYCTNTDSDGFVVGLHTPLDFPRMKDNGLAVRTRSEAFISVHPEITISADSARRAALEKRHCYFEGERKLDHYKIYTSSNCLDECIAKITNKECGCFRFYMPRHGSLDEETCTPYQYECTSTVQANISKIDLDKECDKCWPSCTDIKYHTEVTSLALRQQHIEELLKQQANLSLSDIRAGNLSVIHVFISVDSVFPRLRKEMTTIIDLISDSGCLLGLCMGFSMLSLLEIVYHATMRVCCRKYNESCKLEKCQQKTKVNTNNLIGKPMGYLSKIFSSESNRNQESSGIKKSEEKLSIPDNYFQSSFQTDFQRAYIATAWRPVNSMETI